VSIIKLKKPVELNEHTQITCLPNGSDYPLEARGYTGYVAGWGLRQNAALSSVLEVMKVGILPYRVCNGMLGSLIMTQNQLCAG
jgi:hypothetical protein